MSGISTNATNQPVELRVGILSLGRGLEIIQFKTISNETLNLDDKCFISCTLIDSILEYSGEPDMTVSNSLTTGEVRLVCLDWGHH